MPSTALNAQGTTFQVDNITQGTPDVLVSNVKSFSGFDGESSEIDITNLSSSAKEFAGGLQDFGSFSVEWDCDYNDSGQNTIRAAQSSSTIKTFLLTFPNGDTAQFSAIVKNAQAISGGVDQVLTGSASFKITGGVVFS